MSTQGDGDGIVDAFVKGAVFTVGAAVAGLVLRRVFRREPEVVVVAVSADELPRGRGRGGNGGELDGGDLDDADELEVDLDDLGDEEDDA